jgi:hypothetical protein
VRVGNRTASSAEIQAHEDREKKEGKGENGRRRKEIHQQERRVYNISWSSPISFASIWLLC